MTSQITWYSHSSHSLIKSTLIQTGGNNTFSFIFMVIALFATYRSIEFNDIPNFNTVRHGRHSIRYFRPYLWSKLPNEIRNISSLTTFRSRIRKTNVTIIAIYATLNLFLVLTFLYIAIHSYHTFYRSNFTTLFIILSMLFLCLFLLCPS